ncbi:nitronate monooxygenase [Klebsiella pneumoniae]|nr:nitronate monooxygenase [Klebsiella pneumoniae]
MHEETMSNPLLSLLDINYPLIQAPMAGVSTPALAAAVSNAGALGSLGLGASTVAQAEAMIVATRQLTDRPFNVNLFCHASPRRDARREADWATTLRPHFARYGSTPPDSLSEIYQTFVGHAPMLELLLDISPAVVSFHFGLPERETIQRLRRRLTIPVVAAGGIMDGAGIASVMQLGAQGVQLGTAFLLCPESAADAGYRAAIHNSLDGRTVLTSAISGRPARCLANAFCALGEGYPASAVPDYPLAYDIGKALAAAAKAQGVHEYGAHWAGQGVGLIRECDAASLVRQLAAESGWN